MKTTGNTIFFTGGTSGLGLGLARRFRDLGNTVIISGRRQDLLDRITAEDGIEGVALDVADPDSIPVTSRPPSRRSTSTCSARSAPSPRSRRTC
jgi:short-subunit dehydrogenase involved in D-alanine esterification of teichoic acids